MANVRGICKNCGSMIVFNEKEEKCECIFCHCIFPSSEAIEIMNNPEGREFPNEKFEATDSSKHYYSTPVMPDVVTPAVNRAKVSQAPTTSKIESQYEVTAKDVKAPKNVIIAIAGITAAVLVVVAAVSIPLYLSRTELKNAINSRMETDVIADVVNVDTDTDEDGNTVGYSIDGQSCKSVDIVTEDEVDAEKASTLYGNYCQVRADELGLEGDDAFKGVNVSVFCSTGIYSVETVNGEVSVEFTENPVIETTETAAETDAE